MRLSLRSTLLGLLLAAPVAAQFAETEVSPPGAAAPFRIDASGWTWQDLGAGITYSVHRSPRPDGGFACILDRHPTPSWSGDATLPGVGNVLHYLVTGFDGTVDNSPGHRSDGVERTIDTPCARTRACCLADGTCQDLDAAACTAAGGLDSGLDCGTVTCPAPMACCLGDGRCRDMLPEDCRNLGAAPQGLGTECATVTCPLPTEQCCLTDGRCFDMEAAACIIAGGAPQGAGTSCAAGPACVVPCAFTPVPGRVPLRMVQIGPAFDTPVYLTAPPGDPRLFILERPGRIIIQRPDGSRTEFANFTPRVTPLGTTERGALGLAFHPDYATNGLFYVHYSAPGAECGGSNNCGTISEMRVSANPDVAEPGERLLLQVADFASNHNGGWLGFGPDGMLYAAYGDGGNADDPQRTGQDLNRLLGKMLRIDVDVIGPTLPYGIPADNPFVGVAGARAEIWSYGLRNHWRNSFDRETGDLYIADVGQNEWEEVNVSPATGGVDAGRGSNYGWSMYESNACFRPPCDPAGKEFPDWEYGHGDGCSITGGYVYRGCRMPDWNGWYFFGDYCTGFIHAFNHELGVVATHEVVLPGGSARQLVSFGEDAQGELYVIRAPGTPPSPGFIYRLEP